MDGPADIFISGAQDDAAAMRQIADAITAAGITCVAADSRGETAATLEALERCRALVLVLSAAACRAPHVVRELERAAGRAIPIVTYAIEDVEPSPSIKYFTGTIPAIEAWRAPGPERSRQALVEACRETLRSLPSSRSSRRLRSRFSRALYVESRHLLLGVGAALTFFAVLDLVALVRDSRLVFDTALGWRAAVTAAEGQAFVPTLVGPAGTLWTVMVGSLLVLRRARQNLVAQFAQGIRTGAREIVWRTFVPLANGFWLPRMAHDLWQAAAPDPHGPPEPWPLARYWRATLLASFAASGVRDIAYRGFPDSGVPFTAASVVIEVTCLALSGVTYLVLAAIDRRVRARRQRDRRLAPANAAVATTTIASQVLLIHEPEDAPVAARVADVLTGRGCRCWTCGEAPPAGAIAAFDAVLVVVSRASHFSARVLGIVQSALASGVSVLPFVIETPPDGSPLGHYVRSLHWLDASAGLGALQSIRLGPPATAPVDAAPADVKPVAIDERTFSLVRSATPIPSGRYRPVIPLRRAARGLAIAQAIAASLGAAIAAAIAISPDGADDPSGNISISLAVVSLPSWLAFLVWLSASHRNSRILSVPGAGTRLGLLLRVGIPGVSLAVGGRALAGLFRSLRGDVEPGIARRASRLRTRWMTAGGVLTVCVVPGWILGQEGLIRAAMLLAICQAIATASRGVMRATFIRDVALHQDTQARLWLVSPPGGPPRVETGVTP